MIRTKVQTSPLLEDIGEGSLWLGFSGQGLDALRGCPVSRANMPGHGSRCDTAHLARYDDTDFFQWYGRRGDGRFYPFGKIMRLTDAGRAALASAREVQP